MREVVTISAPGASRWSLLGDRYLTEAMPAAPIKLAKCGPSSPAPVRPAPTGHDGNYAWTAFGPTNVSVHDVSAAMDAGDFQLAPHLAPQVDGRPVVSWDAENDHMPA
jgi:hypothetical protein